MNNVYFNDFFSIVSKKILSAKKYIKIAVCWINFDLFNSVLTQALNAGINISIVISDHTQNRKYQDIIDSLLYTYNNRISIKIVSLYKWALMHEKFCIIDGVKVLAGSYNWTQNASRRNCENLLEIDDAFVVKKFECEFYQLLSLDVGYYKDQFNRQFTDEILVAVIEQENEYQSKFAIYKVERGTVDCEAVYTDYPDISLYMAFSHIGDEYFDEYEYNRQNGIKCEIEDAEAKYEFDLHRFIINHLHRIKEFPYIHAIGVFKHQGDFWHYDEVILKIIWKNRFISHIIRDEYDLP